MSYLPTVLVSKKQEKTLEISTAIFIFEVINFWKNQNCLFTKILLGTFTEISQPREYLEIFISEN